MSAAPPSLSPAAAARALRAHAEAARSVLLTGPAEPDGDSIGASLALAAALRRLGVERVDVVGPAPARYAWLPGVDALLPPEAAEARAPHDLAVVLDGDRGRLETPVAAAFERARVRAIVDHHRSTRPVGYDLALVDPDSPSTCELVHAVLSEWAHPIDAEVAVALYVGILFDTGGFRHSNTRPSTHRLAAELLEHGIDHAAIAVRVLAERRPEGLRLLGHALSTARFEAGGRVALSAVSLEDAARIGARPEDVEGIVDMLLYTEGVELACLLVEKAPGRTKLSLRSRRRVDVARLAARIAPGGGGHVRAAGVLVDLSFAEALRVVPPRLVEAATAP